MSIIKVETKNREAKVLKINLPLTKEEVLKLKAGDVLELWGEMYTARDAAHKRFVETLEKGGTLPIDLKDATIFYAGPCPPKPGEVTGPIGPTTSIRMDPYVEPLIKEGMIAMIGKGERQDSIRDLCKNHKVLYLLGIGGAATVYAEKIKSLEEVAYEDLGTESVKRLEVEGLKVIVGIDTEGNVLHKAGREKFKR